MNIVVLAGGTSTERDISILTSTKVCESLRRNGHNANIIDVFFGIEDKEAESFFTNNNDVEKTAEAMRKNTVNVEDELEARKKSGKGFFGDNVLALCSKADIVFMGLHGSNGEDGKIQAAFDLFGVKYTGSDYLSSAIAMNKETSKQFFLANGIPTPKGISMTRVTRQDDITKLDLTLPCVVKPCCGGSSIGVTIVRDAAEFKAALDDAFKAGQSLAFNWFYLGSILEIVQGREFSVGVIEGKALPIIEIAPKEGFYDYKNKYKAGSTVETCPAELPEKVTKDMQHYAEEVARVIGLDTYSRSDFLLNDKNEMFCLEANTLPGMTPTSLLPQEAAVIGMSFNQLCEHLIDISLKKYEV